ncbi:MAG: carboxylesterase/lipase family protein [Actinobacteria bacterium]|nr:carboxylesterase/lipase family protein [Actinomycetota bacterium]
MESIVETTAGKLQGREKNGLLLFAGIPFAAPPVGDLRFRPPQPVEPWGGVRAATHFSKVAPQAGAPLGGVITAPPPDWDEDCLYLNVQTPALDDASRPVIVWIHGGGFLTGTGAIPWYDGANFVIHGDIVAVTINYRLGALGWMHLGELDAGYRSSANNGLLDQIAALEWVRDNIAAFGGDPANVTIFGESAGGMSVATLLGTPRAKGLFHRAIPQSGAAHHVTTTDEASEVTQRMLEQVGVNDIEGLLKLDAERMLEVQGEVNLEVVRDRVMGETGNIGLSFTPVVDGDVLPQQPRVAVREGLNAGVPLLIGTTRDEWNLFAMGYGPVDDDETIARRIGRRYPDASDIVGVYRSRLGDAPSNDVWSAIMTDLAFRQPAIRLAEAQALHSPDHTFMYLFDWASPAFGGQLGACHSLEIPFVFDNLGKPGVDILTGPDAPQSVADDMHAAWIAFVRDDDPNGSGLPEWPAYSPDGERETMRFDTPSHLDSDPESTERQLWEAVL